jgi:hypothetical protein
MSLLFGAVVIAAATWYGAPTLGPMLVGFLIGLAWPERAVRSAAGAAILAWGGLLLYSVVRGTDLTALATSLGAAMGLPGWALVVATLLYPVILASAAAWLGHVVTPRQFFWSSKANYHSSRR